MGSGNTSSSAARKARIEEMRRAEQARERRNRVLVIGASVVAVAALVVGGVFVVNNRSDASDDSAAGKTGEAKNASGQFVTGADGVKTWQGTLSRNHVTKSVDYPMQPPVGGDHHPIWADCNGTVYTKAVKNENAVHSLEHGAVWVTYTDKAAKADVEALAAKVKKTPYTLMSPYENQDAPIVLSAWGHQRTVKSASDPAVDAFLQEYVQGKQTPEPGASCSGGTMQ
ncbi:DUF3105 domain-containing protein [Streptomyces griseosporeus]|uniref:DUF3105 domain-containing protein n=1 Tax=Streptomyces griseosporeus TaxID=1910 RepID=UPI0037A4A552